MQVASNSITTSKKLYGEFESCKQAYFDANTCDDTVCIDVELLGKCISCLKRGKAAGLDGIEVEHHLHTQLFNLFLLFFLTAFYIMDMYRRNLEVELLYQL